MSGILKLPSTGKIIATYIDKFMFKLSSVLFSVLLIEFFIFFDSASA